MYIYMYIFSLFSLIFFKFYFIFKLYNIVLVLPYYQNESATGIHVLDSLLSELPGKSFTKFYMGMEQEISTSSFKSSKIQSWASVPLDCQEI